VQTGLIRAAASSKENQSVNYIKPLQCGGSDESFVLRHDRHGHGLESAAASRINCQTLFSWNTPASPHLASRWENLPASDAEVAAALGTSLGNIINSCGNNEIQASHNILSTTIIETAGGALSPSSSSPLNKPTNSTHWGWSTQADLYSPFNIPAVFVGDAKLGGISVTVSSLEALWNRGYNVDAVVFIDGNNNKNGEPDTIRFGEGNAEALKEYVMMQNYQQDKVQGKCVPYIEEDAIVLLPSLPPMPIPLDDWYDNNRESFVNLNGLLNKKWPKHFS
jgi:dethiobiotin synthetase/adenosylmethionine--8-amino-7-oxononanoate aminotransferase